MSWTRHIKHPSDMFSSGDKISAKILKIDAEEKKISMGVKQLQDNPWNSIESKYPIGTDCEGIVQNLTQFGAFVELEEGIDGLVHISDMSWTLLVRHPKEIVQKGDKIKIRILDVSVEDRRLSLGMKQMEDSPWDDIRKKFVSGNIVEAEIVKILDKGIIFKLDSELEGIVPLKRLKNDEKQNILMNYKEGEKHDVTIQEVDEESKKIILMMDLNDGQDGKEKSVESVDLEDTGSEPEKIEVPQDIIDKISGDENADTGETAD